MDTWLAIASRREVRDYADRPIPDEIVERILDAGRLAGSANNRQPWRFILVEDRELKARLADQVFVPGTVAGAPIVVVLAVSGKGPVAFDAGRASQNMFLTAWNEGVGSCPNGMPDAEATARLLELGSEERPVIVLTFGYPARPRDPESQDAMEWSDRANRKPLDEIVDRR